MTRAVWTLVNHTNQIINRAIAARKDIETYGLAEVWATPLKAGGKFGDCEDYVLEKRRALLAGGVPAEALSIAVVATEKGDVHAVLLVNTQVGEFVLDNLTPWVLLWNERSYHWLKRQVAGSPARWAVVEG